MKFFSRLIVSLVYMSFSFSGIAQQDPLPDSAFDRMIIKDITYAIIGEHVPVSGLKVDVSKPEATISGVFKTSWIDLIGFELKGGVTDQNFVILKGFNNFNTAFEGRISLTWIPGCSGAKYGYEPEATVNKRLVRAKNANIDIYRSRLLDTIYVSKVLLNHHLKDVSYNVVLPHPVPSETQHQKDILMYLIRRVLNNPSLEIKDQSTISGILHSMPLASLALSPLSVKDIDQNTYKEEVEKLYLKYEKSNKSLDTDILDKKIENAKEIWTQKHYVWFSLSPFARTEKVNEYYTKFEGLDSLYFKADYRFYYGVSFDANYYVLHPKKQIAQLLRGHVNLSHSNNLKTLNSFNYETQIPFFSYPNATTNQTKSGIAYTNNQIKTGFVTQVGLEYYLLPLRTAVPGIYLSPFGKFSKLFNLPDVVNRQNDKSQIGMEGGFVFNFGNREKDKGKNIFSLLAYLRHEDLTDRLRTSTITGEEESKDEYRKRNFSIGLKVGIPINLPKAKE